MREDDSPNGEEQIKHKQQATGRRWVPLDADRHADLRYSDAPRYAYAAGSPYVLIAEQELRQVAQHYPILFVERTSEQGQSFHLPVALFGLEENSNLFLDEAGNWRADYVPALVRMYPFSLEGDNVCIDLDAPSLSEFEGIPLFGEKGQYSPFLQEELKFLKACQSGVNHSRELAGKLLQAELLRKCLIQVQGINSRGYNLGDFYVVDQARLHNLKSRQRAGLDKSGASALIYAHLDSLRHIDALVERRQTGSRSAGYSDTTQLTGPGVTMAGMGR